MEIDQLIFKRLHSFYRKVKARNKSAVEGKRVLLEPLKPRLTLLARALTGIQNDILTSEREGGWSGKRFFLPESIAFATTEKANIDFFVFRVLYLSIQQQLQANWMDGKDHSIIDSQQEANNSSVDVLNKLFIEYPATETIFNSIKTDLELYCEKRNEPCDYSWIYGRWMQQNLHEFQQSTESLKQKTLNSVLSEIQTEIAAKPSDEVITIGIDQKQVEDNVISNNFEKVETLSEFNGTFREMDGDDTLKEDEDAIRELNLKHTVRVDDTAHSVYRAEFVNGATNIYVHESEEAGMFLHYNEWNYKKRSYKPDFCKVYPSFLSESVARYAEQTLSQNMRTKQELLRLFAKVYHEREKVQRVVSGDDIDFDAATDMYAEIMAQSTPSDRVYISQRKRKKDLSVLILMDTSLSADGYTKDEHILDVEKRTALLLGEVLEHHGVSFEIDCFSSRTRNNCSFRHVKTFKENWRATRNRIGAIQTQGYTRIGTALRHAGAVISKESTRRKWIILLSDGKPNDYDTYEGTYGIEDVKQALRELDQQHISTFSFAIESHAKYYLPQMFGHANYNILTKTSELPFALSKFFKRMLTD